MIKCQHKVLPDGTDDFECLISGEGWEIAHELATIIIGLQEKAPKVWEMAEYVVENDLKEKIWL